MLFDVNSSVSNFPVTAPLPLAISSSEQQTSSDLYADSWKFLAPNWVHDEAVGTFWELGIDLSQIVQSTSADAHRLIDFLLRRQGSKKLVLQVL